MKITTIGIDLAKNVFQLHGVDERGHTVLRKKLRRNQMAPFFANLEPCLVGMEVGSGAHHWSRTLQSFNHTTRLMAGNFVIPFVKSNKNDAVDAEAICEAVARPNMRFVPTKTVEQQAILAVHRAREGFVKERTAMGNRIRGLLAEFGLVLPQGLHHLPKSVPGLLATAEDQLPAPFLRLIETLLGHLKALGEHVHELERQIEDWHRHNEQSLRLAKLTGVGPITASAFIATVGDIRAFKNGRELAAWLGIVPRQDSSGGKPRLLGISKRGDTYLRTLLIHGARSAIRAEQPKATPTKPWLAALLQRKHPNVAAVALANKTVRIAWALLAHGRDYQADYVSARPAV